MSIERVPRNHKHNDEVVGVLLECYDSSQYYILYLVSVRYCIYIRTMFVPYTFTVDPPFSCANSRGPEVSMD